MKILQTIFLVIALAACAPAAKPVPTQTLQLAAPQTKAPANKTYTSKTMLVTLQYPDYWENDPANGDAAFKGPDGFFRIFSVGMKPSPAKDMCENEMQHNLDKRGFYRYGTKPVLEMLQLDNQPACLVFPSEDQTPDQDGNSILFADYPNSVKEHTLLILLADKDHIRAFIETLKFVR